jgi:hypothetical protein
VKVCPPQDSRATPPWLTRRALRPGHRPIKLGGKHSAQRLGHAYLLRADATMRPGKSAHNAERQLGHPTATERHLGDLSEALPRARHVPAHRCTFGAWSTRSATSSE